MVRMNAMVGRFANDRAREDYLRAYDAMEHLWPIPVERADIPTTFGSTRVRRSGSGNGMPLVLLHGLNGTGSSWHFAIEDLARDREVVAVDVMGTAGRSIQTKPFRADADFGAWFDEVLSRLGLDQVHLLGESNGAWHAARIALYASPRLRTLTLIEPNGFVVRPSTGALLKFARLSTRPTDAGWQRMSEWLTPGVTLTTEELACAKAAMPFRPGVGWPRLLSDAELERMLLPTLAVFGGESVLSRPEIAAARLQEHLADVETVTVPGGGHGVHPQLPGSVRPRVLEFLVRHDRSRAAN